jgi:PmbA protein
VTVLQGFEFGVRVRKNEVENLTEAGSKNLAVKIIKDKKTAVASSEDFSKETLEKLVVNAIKRAELGNPAEFVGLPENRELKSNTASLNLFDPKIIELSPDKKIKLALDTEKIALADKRINNSYGAQTRTVELKRILANSQGFSGEYSTTSCSLSVGVQAGETDKRVEGFWRSIKRHFKELETPEQIAKQAVERTVRQLGAKKIQTQNVPVVLEPGMTAGLLQFLFTCISGMSIFRKASFLVDKLGQKIGNDKITVIDDGLLPGKLGTKPFDTEGVLTQTTTVVDKGVLKNYLCNTYAARKLRHLPWCLWIMGGEGRDRLSCV